MTIGTRVLLMQLSERTSAGGNRYLSGWLGKASVVAFQAEAPDKFGNPVWEVFVAEPQPRRPRPVEPPMERVVRPVVAEIHPDRRLDRLRVHQRGIADPVIQVRGAHGLVGQGPEQHVFT